MYSENSLENVVSDETKNYLCVHKRTFRKKCKIKRNQKIKTIKAFTICGGFWGQNYFFW